jgi:serine/threonine-protein kinase
MDLRSQLQQSLGSAYTLEHELGGGGMSRVFLARETALGRSVVVKVLPDEMAGQLSMDRFRREIALAAQLQHPHIVPLLTAGETDGLPYFTMPFVRGESLRARLVKQGELPVNEAVRILREVASALACAHDQGVVHRDIKPDNVLLSGGAAMVTDFGVAKAVSASTTAADSPLTSLGVALGTPAYMAPEQATADRQADHRIDIYAWGVLAYELLTGSTPFAGRPPQAMLSAHVMESPDLITKRRASVPAPLAQLIMRCLEKRPADRPQRAQDLVLALDAIATPNSGVEPASADAHVSAPRPRARLSGTGMRISIAGMGVVIAIAIGVALWRRSATSTPASALPRSLAVLPLENVSGDTAMQYFVDGMTDELTATVAKIPGLRVASPSAAGSIQPGSLDLKAIGQRLNVGAVLEGKIRRSGDRMRLTVQLTNVADGLVFWSETYEKDVKDAFPVQDAVAQSIASALQVRFTGAGGPLPTKHATENSKAHDLYLRGRYLQAKYLETDLRKSLELFEAALREDPNYALAYAGIAESWGELSDDYMSPEEANRPALAAIDKGMAIDSTLPELWSARGIVMYFYLRDYAAGQRFLERAVRQQFDVTGGAGFYAFLLRASGQTDSADAIMRRFATVDPASPVYLAEIFEYHIRANHVEEASDACTRLVELAPDATNDCRARLDLNAGVRLDEALKMFQAHATSGDRRQRFNGRMGVISTLARMGRRAEARRMLADIETEYRQHYLREDYIANAYGEIGDVPKALEWLERAYQSRSGGIGYFYPMWELNPSRRDPRILAFVKRIGLPDPPPGWLK